MLCCRLDFQCRFLTGVPVCVCVAVAVVVAVVPTKEGHGEAQQSSGWFGSGQFRSVWICLAQLGSVPFSFKNKNTQRIYRVHNVVHLSGKQQERATRSHTQRERESERASDAPTRRTNSNTLTRQQRLCRQMMTTTTTTTTKNPKTHRGKKVWKN